MTAPEIEALAALIVALTGFVGLFIHRTSPKAHRGRGHKPAANQADPNNRP